MVSMILGFSLFIAFLLYIPATGTYFFKETNTVCRDEKTWGYGESKRYCLQGVEIPEQNTQTLNINLAN